MEISDLGRPSGLPIVCRGAGPAGGGRNIYKVLDCQDELIAKMFPPEVGRDMVDVEVSNTLKVRSKGIDAPDIRALVEDEGSFGFFYVKVAGDTYLERMAEGLSELDYWAERFAFIHRSFHMHTVDGVRTMKGVLEESVERSGLPSRDVDTVLDALRALPDGAGICHGDFHPGNVIVTEKGFVIIDWAKMACGHGLADVALSSILGDVWLPYKVQEMGVRLYRKSIEFFRRTYTDAYLILSGEDEDGLDAWKLPTAAARLADGLPWEREGLLKIIGELL